MFLKNSNFKKFTTCTTRKPREGEKEGFDYYFYDKETFLKKVKEQEMFNVKEYGGECEFLVRNNIELIESLISGLNTSIDEKGVEKVFNGAIAQKWDQKAEYVTYYGVKNPITEEVIYSAGNGLKIADIGCGTGKILQKLDKKFLDCNLTDWILVAI